jgi:hypothetical protein
MTYETVPLQQLLREIADRTASPGDADAIRLAADTLDRLAGTRDWIPVTERLPEEGLNVLVRATEEWRADSSGPWHEVTSMFGGVWAIDSATVTHWMPIPGLQAWVERERATVIGVDMGGGESFSPTEPPKHVTKSGFTVVEALVVLAFLATVVGLFAPSVMTWMGVAKPAAAEKRDEPWGAWNLQTRAHDGCWWVMNADGSHFVHHPRCPCTRQAERQQEAR